MDQDQKIAATVQLLQNHVNVESEALRAVAAKLVTAGALAFDRSGQPFVYDEGKAGGAYGFALRVVDKYGAFGTGGELPTHPAERTIAQLQRRGLDPAAALAGWTTAMPETEPQTATTERVYADTFEGRAERSFDEMKARGIDPAVLGI